MFNKKIIIFGLFLLFIAVPFNLVNATHYEGYSITVDGFDFNMINGYEQYSEITDEDSTDIDGSTIHLYIEQYYNSNDSCISIGTNTRYSAPYTKKDLEYIGSNEQDMTTTNKNIGGKSGKLVEDRSMNNSQYSYILGNSTEYTFWYVEDGKEISIQADSVDKIQCCLSKTN